MPIFATSSGFQTKATEFDEEFDATIEKISLLYKIAGNLDFMLSQYFDRKNNNNDSDSRIDSSTIPEIRNKSRPSHPWTQEILDLILETKVQEPAPESILNFHQMSCPWFYDTIHNCVSLPTYGSVQHELVQQYYKEPSFWIRREIYDDDSDSYVTIRNKVSSENCEVSKSSEDNKYIENNGSNDSDVCNESESNEGTREESAFEKSIKLMGIKQRYQDYSIKIGGA